MNVTGIIGAMDEEVEIIKSAMDVSEVVEKAGCHFFVGTIGEKPVVVVRCGIGKVNAAMCTQLLIDNFNAASIINTGVAGAVADGISVGDVVISADALQHDMDCSPLGDPVGVIPRMEESIFKADETLVAAAKAASEKVISKKTHIGRVVSGDRFIAGFEEKIALRNKFNGACAEMEGAAIAHVCYLNKVPYVIVRNISDSADGSADISFAEFCKTAADHSGKIVLEMLKNM